VSWRWRDVKRIPRLVKQHDFRICLAIDQHVGITLRKHLAEPRHRFARAIKYRNLREGLTVDQHIRLVHGSTSAGNASSLPLPRQSRLARAANRPSGFRVGGAGGFGVVGGFGAGLLAVRAFGFGGSGA
jgi:hypothetical protein